MNVKKHLLLSIIFLQSFFQLAAQTTSSFTFKNVVGPSPNPASLDKYGDIPVSLYSGVPEISVPVYTIVNKDIKLPISLSYHAGGIRVDEEASRVGLGWVLNAGGVINRSVNGNDDFRPIYGYLNNNAPEFCSDQVGEILKRSSTNVLSTNPDVNDCNRSILGTPYDLSPYLPDPGTASNFHIDLEPDVFTYNIGASTGKFVIKKNKQIIKQKPDAVNIKLLDNQGLKWQITTPDGVRYIFDKTEECMFTSAGNQDGYITTWYLTKIISLSGAELTFHYAKYADNTVQTLNNIQEKHTLFIFDMTHLGACSGTVGKRSSYPPVKQYPLVLLDSITYPYGSVSFEYADRIDLKNDKRIAKIRINDHANPFYSTSYDLGQNYFTTNYSTVTIPDPTQIDQSLFDKRLKLLSLEKKDNAGNVIQNYAFTYNEAALPSKKSYARDHWGFFNGAGTNSTFIPKMTFRHPFDITQVVTYSEGANREPDSTFSKAFTLKEIRYPSGGRSVFDYEQNDFDPLVSAVDPVKEVVTETKDFMTRRSLDETFELTLPQRLPSTQIAFEITSEGGQAITAPPYPWPEDAYIEIYPKGSATPIKRTLLGSESFWQSLGNFRYKRTDVFDFPPGEYTIKTHIASTVLFLNYITFKFTYSFEKTTLPKHEIKLAGGLRIHRITDQDPASGKSNVRRFQYRYNFDYDNDGLAEECSYGRMLAGRQYTNHEILVKCNGNEAAYCDAFNLYSDTRIQLEEPVVGYDKVALFYGENGENGKEEAAFENASSTSLQYTFGSSMGYVQVNVRTSGLRDMIQLGNGMIRNKTIYRRNPSGSGFNKLKETTYSYSSSPEVTMLGIAKIAELPAGAYGTGGILLCQTGKCGWVVGQYPIIQSSWSYIDSIEIRDYDPDNGAMIMSHATKYKYEASTPIHYQPVEATFTNSKGIKHRSYSIYPSDYATGTPFLDGMIARNLVTPIENVVMKEDDAGSKYILSGLITKYRADNPSLQDGIYTITPTQPVPLSSFKFSNRAIGVLPTTGNKSLYQPDVAYQHRINFDKYSIANNLTEQTKIGDIKKSYIWDYNDQYPVAEVTNADVTNIAFTSFEGNNTSWAHTGAAVDDAATITGRRSYSLSAGSISKTGLQTGATYVVSYWTRNTVPYTIAGTKAGFPAKGRTVNGWTYFEHRVTGINNISISGSGYIDELRFYPESAQMSSFTYEPGIGLTSQCDSKNQVTYYDYDSSGRLKLVKDQDGKILKQYDYQYQQPVTQ